MDAVSNGSARVGSARQSEEGRAVAAGRALENAGNGRILDMERRINDAYDFGDSAYAKELEAELSAARGERPPTEERERAMEAAEARRIAEGRRLRKTLSAKFNEYQRELEREAESYGFRLDESNGLVAIVEGEGSYNWLVMDNPVYDHASYGVEIMAEVCEALGLYAARGRDGRWRVLPSKAPEAAALPPSPPEGVVVLEEFEVEGRALPDALVFLPDGAQRYAVAHDFDEETGEWSRVDLFSDPASAYEKANPKIIEGACIKLEVEDLQEALVDLGCEPSAENVAFALSDLPGYKGLAACAKIEAEAAVRSYVQEIVSALKEAGRFDRRGERRPAEAARPSLAAKRQEAARASERMAGGGASERAGEERTGR